MDSISLGGPQLDPSKLTPQEIADVQTFALQETKKSRIQGAVHNITDVCFRKCVGSRMSAGGLSSSEEPCMRSCVDRFLETNTAVLRHLESLRR